MPKKPKGRHPHHKLTAVKVKSIKTAGRYADGNGLYLFVEPSGSRRWVLRTVVHTAAGTKRRDLGLGSAQLVSLAEARAEASRLRLDARKRVDILAVRRVERRVVPTFEVAAKAVHTEHGKSFRNPKHRAGWLASLAADVFPLIGTRPVNAIDSGDVLKVLSPIWTSKPETARRVKQRMKTVFDWAKAHGLRSGDNPTDGIEKILPRVRATAEHHSALPYAQVPTFIETVRKARASESAKLAFEFLILTAARTNEVVGARWDEIDRDAKTWTIPAGRIKAGREHRVPLSDRCLELLEAAAKLVDGGGYVFPGRSEKAPMSNMVFLMLLRRIERTDITTHGFRSTFRDWAAERTNMPRSVCEAALAHVVGNKTEAAYFRSDLFEQRRKLMDSWERFATATPAAVVQLHG